MELLIREESVVVGYEMLSCLCELLLARFSLVETEKRLPPDLKVSPMVTLCFDFT